MSETADPIRTDNLTPASDYWLRKLARNKTRDAENQAKLHPRQQFTRKT